MTVSVEAVLWMDAARPGGSRAPLRSPVVSLLLVAAVPDFRERAGQDAFVVAIRPSGGRDLAPDAQEVPGELTLDEAARPWVRAGSEFYLLTSPLEAGRGRVIAVQEGGA